MFYYKLHEPQNVSCRISFMHLIKLIQLKKKKKKSLGKVLLILFSSICNAVPVKEKKKNFKHELPQITL